MWLRWLAHRLIEAVAIVAFGAAMVVPVGLVYDLVWFAPVRADLDAMLADASPSERQANDTVRKAFGIGGKWLRPARRVAELEWFRKHKPVSQGFPGSPEELIVVLVWPTLLTLHYDENELTAAFLHRHGWGKHGAGAFSLRALGKDLNELSEHELKCLVRFVRASRWKGGCDEIEPRLRAAVADRQE